MRISRRTSKGRGEYEVSEEHDGLAPRDLLNRRIVVDLARGWRIDTGARLVDQGGKPRLRLLPDVDMQLPRQLAAALLMPHPVRTREGGGRGRPVLRADEYAIETIELANVRLVGASAARVSIEEVYVGNYNIQADALGFADRVSNVRMLWSRADEFPTDIADLLGQHEELTQAGPIGTDAEKVVEELQARLTESSADFNLFYRTTPMDVVPDLLEVLGWAHEPPPPPIEVTDVPPENLEIRRRTVREWKQWASARGAASARFRRAVRDAYNSTCLVCGAYLPATTINKVAGVEGAHILPWSKYDLDHASNGLCMCRHHHWAFDQGLIVITHDGTNYRIEIPADVRASLTRECPALLEELSRYDGVIPPARLPRDRKVWPDPRFLAELYEYE